MSSHAESLNVGDEQRGTGDGIAANPGRWTFAEGVSETFDAHVRRSVPLYEEGHKLVCGLSEFFVKSGSLVYELGSSTGSLISRLATRHSDLLRARFIGLDVEAEMIQRARASHIRPNLIHLEADLVEVELDRCDMVVSYYTMQFIPPKHRQAVYDKIYRSLEWGGAFILFEKTRAPDARFQDIMTTLYLQYKLDNGFACDEVLRVHPGSFGFLTELSQHESDGSEA